MLLSHFSLPRQSLDEVRGGVSGTKYHIIKCKQLIQTRHRVNPKLQFNMHTLHMELPRPAIGLIQNYNLYALPRQSLRDFEVTKDGNSS